MEEKFGSDDQLLAYKEEIKKYLAKEIFNPDVSSTLVTEIRNEYSSLIQKICDEKDTISDSSKIIEYLDSANKAFENVKRTADATLDARVLSLTSDIATQKVCSASSKSNLLNPLNLAHIFSVIFLSRNNKTHIFNELLLNWNGTFSTNFVPVEDIDVQITASSRTRKRTFEEEIPVNRPGEFRSLDEYANDVVSKNEKSTSLHVLATYNNLKNVEPIEFYRFVLDPNSFSRSVESIFYLSFLITDNRVCIYLENNEPFLATIENGNFNSDEQNINRLHKIVSLNYKRWQEYIIKYDIKKPLNHISYDSG